jgi:hypothetical protein
MTTGLQGLQRCLERIYEVDAGYDVEQFTITDGRLARGLEGGAGGRETREKLLVHEGEDRLDISLYLDSGVMEVLRRDDPLSSLNDGNLAAFWTAIEGISHFLYLIWNARHGRGISLFELELQAEVDKFAAAVVLIGRQRGRRVPRGVYRRLFAAPAFDRALDAEELRRYRDANRYAALYCRRLQRDCLEARRFSMVRDLRRFYRLTHGHKLRHITRSGDPASRKMAS